MLLGMVFIPSIIRPRPGVTDPEKYRAILSVILYIYMTVISLVYVVYYTIRVVFRRIRRRRGTGGSGEDNQKSDIIKMILFFLLGLAVAVYPVTLILFSVNLQTFQVPPRSRPGLL
ncbi:MAG: hypothetical protein P9L90_03415 [Candidatus Aadella gelida]|nr:hypothetical protein [Candidatus Aadella gelida]